MIIIIRKHDSKFNLFDTLGSKEAIYNLSRSNSVVDEYIYSACSVVDCWSDFFSKEMPHRFLCGTLPIEYNFLSDRTNQKPVIF